MKQITYLVPSIIILAFAATLALPSGTYAKNVKTEANVSATSSPSCLKAFGHLVAPGWIKKNGPPNIAEDCPLPRGIAKLLGRIGGGNPNDVTAPVLSGIDVDAATTSAVIMWDTNERADGAVFYGTTSPLNLASSSVESSSLLRFHHSVELSGLEASTTYFAVIRSRDAAGNIATSSELSFTTATDDEDDVTPPVISGIVATAGTSTIGASWNTNENADSKVYYGTTTPLDIGASTTPFVASGSLSTSHALSITGLSASTTYHLVVESRDTEGNTATSSELSVPTSGL